MSMSIPPEFPRDNVQPPPIPPAFHALPSTSPPLFPKKKKRTKIVLIIFLLLFVLMLIFGYMGIHYGKDFAGKMSIRVMGYGIIRYSMANAERACPSLANDTQYWVPSAEELSPKYIKRISRALWFPMELNINPDENQPSAIESTSKLIQLAFNDPLKHQDIFNRILASQYLYFGWEISSEDDAVELAKARREHLLPDSGNYQTPSGKELKRLHWGQNPVIFDGILANKTFIPSLLPKQSYPAIIFLPSFSLNGVYYVLYTNGLLQEVKPGVFPCTKTVFDAVGIPFANAKPSTNTFIIEKDELR